MYFKLGLQVLVLYSHTSLPFVAVDLLQRTRVMPSRTKGLTSDLSQVAGSAARIQDMLTTVLAYIEDVLVSIKSNWKNDEHRILKNYLQLLFSYVSFVLSLLFLEVICVVILVNSHH